MVTIADKRPKPCADLEIVKELAAKEAVQVESRRVEHNARDLGYSFSAVCKCISELQAKDFRHAVRYQKDDGNWTPWLDVYLMSYQLENPEHDLIYSASPPVHELYIKLRLGPNCLVVCLHSFHQENP